MINIKELRLGNYVMYEQTTHVVTELCRTPNRIIVGTKWIKGDGHYTHYPSELDPIPLTEEILLKCGFFMAFASDPQDFNPLRKYTIDEFELLRFTDDVDYFYSSGKGVHTNIKHLHHLMNIIFDLTGKELEYEF